MIEIKSVNLEVNKDTIRKYKSHVPSELIDCLLYTSPSPRDCS